jgi:hypothetical protein
MGVHGATAHGGSRAPDLPKQLYPRRYGAAPADEREQQPELRMRYPNRLAGPQDSLSSRLDHHASKPYGAGPSARATRRKRTGPVQQLLNPGHQLPNDRDIGCSAGVERHGCILRRLRLERARSPELVLVDNRPSLGVGEARMGSSIARCTVASDDVAAGSTRSWTGVVVDDENARSVSAGQRIGCGSGATAIDTGMTRATPASPVATIESAGYRRNRMGVKCCWATTKCVFGGMKGEQRFNCRRTEHVSSRALRRVLHTAGLSFERVQLLSDDIGPQVEVRSVPGRNAGSQDDCLGGSMDHANPLCEIAG